jgi:hypothetical protein
MKKGTPVSKTNKPKVKRKGVHSKTKNSRSKHAKNYAKKYNGQG